MTIMPATCPIVSEFREGPSQSFLQSSNDIRHPVFSVATTFLVLGSWMRITEIPMI